MRVNTSWAFAGNAVYAGCQWAVLVLLINSLSQTEVGRFAYALAVTAPIFVLANVRLRNLLASGIPTPAGFRDYLTTRLLTTAGGLIVSMAIALFSSSGDGLVVLAFVAVARSCDAVSDICHGLMQRELNMRAAAIGLMTNGLVSILLVSGSLAVWRSLPLAALAYAIGSAFALAAWDLPQVVGRLRMRGDRVGTPRWHAVRTLLLRSLPLGLSSAVGSVQTNLPRYAIAAMLGPAPLAVFAAISHFPLLGHLPVNAAAQAALPLLAEDARAQRPSYRHRLSMLVAASLGLGAIALVLTIVTGRTVLGTVYGPEYAGYVSVLVWLMATAVVTFTSVFLGAGTTARGKFGTQLAISVTSLAVVAISLGPLVSRFGLNGAACALLLAALVEFGAYVGVTVRDLRRVEGAPALMPAALAGGLQP
jgi:O-antigen/teichoic acid export membrane protein